nr:hypothetical protein [Tanacetum cinerariifolium]
MRTRSVGWPVAESRGEGTGGRVGRGGGRGRGLREDKIMVAAGGNIRRKTPQEAYDLIKNMTQHHFQSDAKVYYDTTPDMSAHNSDTTYTSIAPVEVLGNEEKSSGSTTTHSDYSLLNYEAFYFDDDHIKENTSGSTTTHSYFSLPEYDWFIFDLSIDPLPPADRREFTSVVGKNIFDLSSSKDFKSIELNDTLLFSDYDSSLSKEFSEIDLLVSFTFGNEDIIFDPGIFIIKRVESKRFHIFPLDDFPTFSFVSDSLLLIDPSGIETFLSFPFGIEDKVFDPGIFFINGVFSFTRRTPNLLSDNFLIDKCHIFREISLMTESSVIFHPKNK